MIDYNLAAMYNLPVGVYGAGGPMPPPGTNPQPGLPPSGSPFYQWPNPLQGAEEWLLGAAASLAMPFAGPFLIAFVVLLVVAVVVIGGGAFGMGLVLGDNS